MAERKPVVLVGGQLKELPAGDTLPPQAPASHSHATSDVTGLDAALSGKETAISTGSTSQYWRGDKTWRDFFTDVRAATLTGLSTATNAVITATDTVLSALGKLQKQVSDNLTTLTNHTANTSNPHSVTKSQVGLGNVDNTSDANKPISSATQTALNAKAPLASPALTGTPTAPTATDGVSTTQVATTAFVQSAVGGYLSKAVTGGTVSLTAAEASNPVIALTGTLTSALSLVVPAGTNRLWAIYNATSGAFAVTVKTAAGTGVTVAQGKRNLVYTDGTNVYDGFNDFESVALTGTSTAPTAATATNTTQIATTAFVQAVNASDTGSAATAVALKTARQINGTSFDGSANVTTANWGTARTITIGSTGKSVNGSGNVTWTLAEIGAGDVTLTGTQTLTNKTLTSPTVNLVKFGSQYAAGNSGTAITLNFANGQKQALTLTGIATVTLSFPGVGNYQVLLTQDATGNRSVTWSGVSRYVGSATAPAINLTANSNTLVSIYYDGANAWLAASKVNA